MSSIIGYELRMQKKSWIVCLAGVVWLGIAWLLQTYIPGVVIKAAQWINAHESIKILFGFTEDITAITYGYTMTIFLIPLVLLLVYYSFAAMADSLLREKYLSTWIYYYTIPVSGNAIRFVKGMIHLVILTIEIAIWGVMAWRLSMCGTKQVEYFVYVVNRDMKNIILGMSGVAVLSIGSGFLYGCIFKSKSAMRSVANILFFLILWALLPNMIQVALYYLSATNLNLEGMQTIQQYIAKSRNYNPIYWSSPLVAATVQLTVKRLVASMITSGVMVVTGVFVEWARCGNKNSMVLQKQLQK